MKGITVVHGAIVASAVALGAPVHAGQIFIENPGFEVTTLSDGDFVWGAPFGWTTTTGIGTFNPTGNQFAGEAPEGNNTAYSNGGFLFQELSDVLAANTTYTLMVDVGNRFDTPFADYVVQIWAGNNLLAEEVAPIPDAGYFETSIVTFTAVATDPSLGLNLGIRFGSFGGPQVNFDNITMYAAGVPSPGALALLGLAGLARRRRR